MKEILISIKPQYCDLIADGKKTVEVRKTIPKLETPFKVYIYCTKGKTANDIITFAEWDESGYIGDYLANGAVIGEFVCDRIENHGINELIVREDAEHALKGTCLTKGELLNYLCYEKGTSIYEKPYFFYGWHISNLVIYDKPRTLNEFKKPCNHKNDWCTCERYDYIGKRCYDKITRPPQSWCYVN